jgi:hypothetical protein
MELQVIQSKIYEIRGLKVILDRDLAQMYEVSTSNLNKAVKRNMDRFPERYMFQLTKEECSRFQFGILNHSRGSNIKYLPYAFTEQGVAMLSGVLHSDIAIQMSINIIDAFVYMRNYIIQNISASKEIENLKERIEKLESANEDTLRAVNDLSEDNRKELDSIYIALSELSIKQEKIDTPRKIITGFKSYNKEAE